MIVIKTIIFFISLLISLFFIEDSIEKIILHMKKCESKFNAEYISGYSETFSGALLFFVVLFWTIFYLLHQF